MPVNLNVNKSTKKASARKKQPKKKSSGGHAAQVSLQMDSESESELVAQRGCQPYRPQPPLNPQGKED
ncbi:hypothetical protein RhiTH_011300 [Rhizoctonia solani]